MLLSYVAFVPALHKLNQQLAQPPSSGFHVQFAVLSLSGPILQIRKRNPGTVTDPRFLMADASEAVFNGAKPISPFLTRLMCYAHVYLVS